MSQTTGDSITELYERAQKCEEKGLVSLARYLRRQADALIYYQDEAERFKMPFEE